MVSLDPADRRTCEYYYTEEYDRSFPASFYDFFHDFVASTNEINAVHPAQSSFSTAVSASGTTTPQIGANANTATLPSAPETDSEIPLPSNADEIINRIWTDFESIERRIDPQRTRQSTLEEQPHRLVTSADVSYCTLPAFKEKTLTTHNAVSFPCSATAFSGRHTCACRHKSAYSRQVVNLSFVRME